MESGLEITHLYSLIYEAQGLSSPPPFLLADIGLFLEFFKGFGHDTLSVPPWTPID